MIVRELIALLRLDGHQFEAQAARAEGLIHGLKVGLLEVAATAVAAGAGLFALARHTSEVADSVANASQDLGITTDQLQELRYSAKQADIGVEELGISMKIFARNAGQAALGKGDVFAKLGVNIRDSHGNLADLNTLLLRTADRLHGIHDASVRAAFGQELFGRAGLRTATWLNQGVASLREQFDEARRIGAVLPPEAIIQGREFDDLMKTLRATVEGLRNALGAELLPYMVKVLKGLKDWYLANSAIARQDIAHVLHLIASALGAIFAIGSGVWGLFDALAKATDLYNVSVGDMAVGLGLAAAFIAPFYVAVAAILLVIEDIVAYFQGRQSVTGLIVDGFRSAFANVKASIDEFVAHWVKKFQPVIDTINAIVKFTGSVFHNEDTGQGRGGTQKTGENVRTGQIASAAAPRPAAVPPALAPATPYPSRAPSVVISAPVSPSRRELNPALASFNAHKDEGPQFLPEKPRPNLRSALLGASSGPGVSPQQQIKGGGRGGVQVASPSSRVTNISVSHSGAINIAVPAGTTADQSKAISKQVREEIDSHWSEQMQRALGDHPSHSGN